MDKATEGKLYKSITVEDRIFHIFFGYYSDKERDRWDPAPIFPDFIKSPLFTKEGTPFARADQDVCDHYRPRDRVSGENWCNDCIHFNKGEDIIGICRCDKRKNIFRQNE